MGTSHSTPPLADREPVAVAAPAPGRPTSGGGADRAGRRPHAVLRWLPAAAAVAVLVACLLATDTPVGAILRYAGYAAWGVLLPGTLVYRSLRRRPHTLVEELAFGAATGLVLELAAWALFVSLGIESAATLWPLLVVVPFAAVPRLRRHWWVRGHRPVQLGWSWSVAGIVAAAFGYLYKVYLERNPILPPNDSARQFVDISYQMSLAGNAKHNFPLTLPQVAGEPLEYHWFAFAHQAMTSLVGHLDLPVVQLRLMIPALVALTLVLTAVVAWRISGRAWAGPVAALLIFAIGEFNASATGTPFGSPQTTLMVWASISMTYSQPLLFALIGVTAEGLRKRAADDEVPALGRGVFVLVALFAFASCAAKATSVPVTLAGLALAGLVVLVRTRRLPLAVLGMGLAVAAAQLFSTAVIFRFKSYGLEVGPLANLSGSWADPQQLRSGAGRAVLAALVCFAFLVNTQLRLVGALPLLLRSRLRLDTVQWFLLGGAVAGPAVFLLVKGWNAGYFTHAGLAFGVVLSAWGFCESFERARLSTRGKVLLALWAVVFTAVATWAVVDRSAGMRARVAARVKHWGSDPSSVLAAFGDGKAGQASGLTMIVAGGLLLVAASAVFAVLWWAASRFLPSLRHRGGIVVLTTALLAGAPTLAVDLPKPTWDATVWGSFPLPAGKVDAARWLRAHSAPSDVVATNEHCWSADDFADPAAPCTDHRDFVLSAYSERSVLVEGWSFAPRVMATGSNEFWDQELLRRNDDAIYHPTAALLDELRDGHGVRYLFVNRKAGRESPELASLAERVFDNGRIGIYELRR